LHLRMKTDMAEIGVCSCFGKWKADAFRVYHDPLTENGTRKASAEKCLLLTYTCGE
jgi:hypothetical protein